MATSQQHTTLHIFRGHGSTCIYLPLSLSPSRASLRQRRHLQQRPVKPRLPSHRPELPQEVRQSRIPLSLPLPPNPADRHGTHQDAGAHGKHMLIRRPPKRAVLLLACRQPNEALQPGRGPRPEAAKRRVISSIITIIVTSTSTSTSTSTAWRKPQQGPSPPGRLPDLVDEEVLVLGGEQRVVKVQRPAELVLGGNQPGEKDHPVTRAHLLLLLLLLLVRLLLLANHPADDVRPEFFLRAFLRAVVTITNKLRPQPADELAGGGCGHGGRAEDAGGGKGGGLADFVVVVDQAVVERREDRQMVVRGRGGPVVTLARGALGALGAAEEGLECRCCCVSRVEGLLVREWLAGCACCAWEARSESGSGSDVHCPRPGIR